jgi:hypothetical protein
MNSTRTQQALSAKNAKQKINTNKDLEAMRKERPGFKWERKGKK